MTVEFDVFSGQPNPRWELTPEQLREFRRRVAALPQPPSPARMFDGLGYRGLSLGDPASPDESFRVGFGWVVHRQGSGESTYVDEGRGVEKWLLSTAKGKVDDRLLASIGLKPNVE
jgi:hypothetical protein